MSARFDAEAHRGELKQMIADGLNLRQIGEHFGLSHVSVWKIIRKLRLRYEDHRRGNRLKPLTDEGRARLATAMRLRWQDEEFRAAQREGAEQWRKWNDPWLFHLPRDWKRTRTLMRDAGVPEQEIRRQIDALRAQELAA